ncbi:MAG: bifunctional 4-hydroxy-2-oxoglutarate aldolase/2-dehydro-3-deoxy-phosphogluconate aldolase [Candidatus Firestonebacteria bacterium RIFOXYC2_FULL_39_67]|nr:MAG: bifunctional 4-hydroxy-2-oxoglutarate aldolase/2-dehydro-3-deoxy-phosphogluconate aldolase [Candidatus Firestonebacteria bacterium RIFOXYD2_FULL_39_29]OGF56491.1 MAG: bifunctional 4-hydroxy-2-oxoglutarate aldolase/2-dehydro-3-deoxy-phosphogluconate aldolase [Candidatus Firestonebacteria bacterium RIFOXYC2_FULL_39_67]
MAKYKRIQVNNAIMESGLVPVFFNKDLEVAKKVAKAVAEGGSKVLEFTNRGEFAYQIFGELVKYCEKEIPGLILGVGSVGDPYTASLFINNGANFIVGPMLNTEVAKICNRKKIPYSPGCGTATEIANAEEMGVEICKIFPGAEVGGPGFVKNLLGPMPWSSIMPTGGVEGTKESIDKWFKAGVVAVGMGSNLISKDVLEKQDWETLAKTTAKILSWIREAKGVPVFTGIEHLGLYPSAKADGKKVTDFYAEMFGFKAKEGNSSFFVSSSGAGRIEVMKDPVSDKIHVAVKVSDFELACKILTDKGIELEEPKVKSDVKAVFLKKTDPLGNKIHLLWTK